MSMLCSSHWGNCSSGLESMLKIEVFSRPKAQF